MHHTHETIRELSDRLVQAQQPIRILNAIQWSDQIEERFLAQRGREMPEVTRETYLERPLGFDLEDKRAELRALERDVQARLGAFHSVGAILTRMCREYRRVLDLLEARGTDGFSEISSELYGSAHDAFHVGESNLADLGSWMTELLDRLDDSDLLEEADKVHDAETGVRILSERLDVAFGETAAEPRVLLSDGIVADAAAGADYVKLRHDAKFSERDLRLLEVHEGWVHLGTNFNARQQKVCTFLQKGPPSSTVTQEGLAVLMEVLTFSSHTSRLRRLANRVEAIRQIEDGADFLEVFRFFREQGFTVKTSYRSAMRAFRGSLPDRGPFTKDLSYTRGFVEVFNFLHVAVRAAKLERIPVLYVGKTALQDVPALWDLIEEGVVQPPAFLPPQLADLHGLAAWLCFSNYLHKLNIERVGLDYARLLA
ncbi:MAG: flavohemoglobin expression-modulating QEGLA motif protein [Acidobacteria bacterium]|nr:MAG: flavohemoglobin expression-modulating QEGLA motif protein [Acidobacteriota bacterium]REK11277.1 MAG: flavohemoglobin expression-modulating QEGLA motif protein [Acidobacteriota bacterium]